MSYRAECLVCEWIAEQPDYSIVRCGHYAMKHVRINHPDAEGFVAVIVKLRRD